MMGFMDILKLVFVGLIFGAIARFVLPGKQNMGWIMTAVLGVAGSLLANYAGTALGFYKQGDSAGWIASIIGAVILLVIYGMAKGKAAGE
jgi:uncharacterized membrane protein YeaQ/YmgE (transglycosylase-associated protein family)